MNLTDNDLDKIIKAREQEEDTEEETVKAVMPPQDVVVYNEMRSCMDLFLMWKKGKLDIKPDFQRDIVWKNKEMSLFIDSLMKQLRIPSICISWDASSGKRTVIDGLQRLATIIRFLNYQEEDWKISQVDGVDERIGGLTVKQICAKEPRLYQILEEATLPINVIRCDYAQSNHMEYLFQIFSRLNSGGRRLLYQEIRNCIYQGPLNTFLKSYVRGENWLRFVGQNAEDIGRYRFGHEERALRFLAFYDNWETYSSSLVQFLNQYMSAHRNMPEREVEDYREMLDRVLVQISRIEGKKDTRKNWNAMEGVLLGIAKNLPFVETLNTGELSARYGALLNTPEFVGRMKEGVMHGPKVRERIEKSIQYFGPGYEPQAGADL